MTAPRSGPGGRAVTRWPVVSVAVILWASAGAAGQDLSIKEQPTAASLLCQPRQELPACEMGQTAEVERLIDDATQAMILGDLALANEFLTRALELNPCAAEAAYLRGRMVAQTEGVVPAAEWFCRYVALEPRGASASEAHRRLDQAVQEGEGSDLLARFEAGTSRFRAGDMEQAERLFTAVLEQHPVPEAFYNRALAHIALERVAAARTDLQRYLDLRPESSDHAAVATALEALGQRRSRKSPATAFALGVVLPGAGHYYTGRVGYGLVVTGLVGGALAAGYFYERTTIQCRVQDPSGECPPDAIASQETERPLLIPALGVAGGLVLASAIEAALRTGGRDGPVTVSVGSAGVLHVVPGPRLAGLGVLDIDLLRFTH